MDLFRNKLNLAPGAPRALRLDARGESFGELQQELGSKISDLGSSSLGVQEPGGHRILAQTTELAEATKYLTHRNHTFRDLIRRDP